MTSKILAPALFAMLVTGCNSPGSPGPSNAPGTLVPTAAATRAHGDVVPSQLVALSIPKPTETALLGGSDALAPRKPFAFDVPPNTVVGSEFRRAMQGTDPAVFTFPVDAPQGARVIVRTANLQPLRSVHLRSVATGQLLDLARDPSTMKNVPHQPMSVGWSAADPSAAPPPDPNERPTALQREPGFAVAMNHRTVSFDLPASPGLVRLEVPADAAAAGVVMELQEPASHITLSGVPTEDNYGYGDTAELTFNLASDGTPIDGAALTGYGELKDRTAARRPSPSSLWAVGSTRRRSRSRTRTGGTRACGAST